MPTITPDDTGQLNLHNQALGSLVMQLHSLEFVLRGAIVNLTGEDMEDLEQVIEGQWVKLGAMTTYEPLGPAISRYNELVPEAGRLDRKRIVALRDMLAHGRIFATTRALPFRLVKFGPERGRCVKVEAVVLMTPAWFKEQFALVGNAIITAATYGKAAVEDPPTA